MSAKLLLNDIILNNFEPMQGEAMVVLILLLLIMYMISLNQDKVQYL